MAINLCYISFIFDDNLLWHSPIRCTKTLMHLKSDFKPNILWENIVLIIHLKISWRWFITCCKKKISWESYKWVGWWNRLFIKPELLDQFLLFSSSIFELSSTDYFHKLLFIRKILFHDIFHSDRGCEISQYFLVQFSLKILSAGRVSRAIEDVSITLESKVLYNPHDTYM